MSNRVNFVLRFAHSCIQKMKKILITGASQGIGYQTARLLALEGYTLICIARNEDALNRLKADFPTHVKVFSCDVTDYLRLQQIHQELEQMDFLPDVIVNNAGMGYFERIEDGPIDHWHHMVDVNIKGVMNVIHVFLPHLIRVHGLIVNVGSVASHQVFPNSAMYASTKHAVKAICDGLRLELAGKVKVTMISPGAVNTGFVDSTTDERMLAEYKPYFATAMDPAAVAEQIKHCIEAPLNTVISEIIIRPDRPVK